MFWAADPWRDAQTKAAGVKADLMTRLGNAIKQRDAAREEALLAGEKLNKLQARSRMCMCVHTCVLFGAACEEALLAGKHLNTLQARPPLRMLEPEIADAICPSTESCVPYVHLGLGICKA